MYKRGRNPQICLRQSPSHLTRLKGHTEENIGIPHNRRNHVPLQEETHTERIPIRNPPTDCPRMGTKLGRNPEQCT